MWGPPPVNYADSTVDTSILLFRVTNSSQRFRSLSLSLARSLWQVRAERDYKATAHSPIGTRVPHYSAFPFSSPRHADVGALRRRWSFDWLADWQITSRAVRFTGMEGSSTLRIHAPVAWDFLIAIFFAFSFVVVRYLLDRFVFRVSLLAANPFLCKISQWGLRAPFCFGFWLALSLWRVWNLTWTLISKHFGTESVWL